MNPEKNPLPEKVQGIISLGQCAQLNKQDTISCIWKDGKKKPKPYERHENQSELLKHNDY